MDIKFVGQQPATEQIPFIPSTTLEGPYDIEAASIGHTLGLEKISDLEKYSSNIKTLLEYAKNNTSEKTTEGLKWAIRKLEIKLGSPALGEDKIKYLARYAWLNNEELRIQKEKIKYEQL